MGDEGRLDQRETEAILFLGRDFNESFAQMRHYRGAHPQDVTGRQMESMVLSLNDEKIDDLIAYINTL